eukprot:gnl/Chilomastix_caulleri/1264.p3 GENE.gnl/Chilomastix_caulleri/1264~~gnl/Chilomastix_caulleri/1264.p3  ORF type:complete len:84 (+),score=16.12 gnl/Chilomastix_caulleri/1264:379-630(+)
MTLLQQKVFEMVYNISELANKLSTCGKECFIEAMLDDASGVVNSFVKDNNSFVVISHSVADVSDKIEKHNELMIKAEIQQKYL